MNKNVYLDDALCVQSQNRLCEFLLRSLPTSSASLEMYHGLLLRIEMKTKVEVGNKTRFASGAVATLTCNHHVLTTTLSTTRQKLGKGRQG
jgi:hypothetical protein